MKHAQSHEFEFHPSGDRASAPGARSRPRFPLTLAKAPGSVRFGHLSDFHFGKPKADDLPSEDAVRRWLDDFAGCEVDLLVMTGDLVEEPGDRGRLAQVKEMLDEAPFGYVVIPGNHDLPEPGRPGPFEELFGGYPAVSHHGDIELLLLDSMKGLPTSDRPLVERLKKVSSGSYSRGKVGQAQLDALDVQMADDGAHFRVMLVHHHLLPNAPTSRGWEQDPAAPLGTMAPLDDAEQLLDWAHQRGVRLLFHGHKHNFWDPYEPRPGLIALNSGSSTRGKPGRKRRARLVDIGPERTRVHVHELELRG